MASRDLRAAAGSGACVLITGRKPAVEALAYRIHSRSAWRYGPITVVDCSWPEAQVRSMLFGEFGDRPEGRVRLSRRPVEGTLVLQEVGKLSAPFQAELAERLAEVRGDKGDLPRRRLIAGTSEPLLRRVAEGSFYHHLYYRLNVIHVIVAD